MRTKLITSCAIAALCVPMAAGGQTASLAETDAVAPVQVPVMSLLPQDPADSLYRSARGSLNAGDYARAADLFQSLRSRHPRSGYAAESYYWEAFARYRTRSTGELRVALRVLDRLARQYPDARVNRDARVLATRIEGELARMGDARAAERVAVAVAPMAPEPMGETPPEPPRADAAPRPTRPTVAVRPPRPGYADPRVAVAPRAQYSGEEDDIRIAALNALMQMDAERAVPILKQVLERRDEGSLALRRKAVFIVAQKRTAGTEEILLDVARSDPSSEVRAEAVTWLSQVPTESAVTALDSIVRESDDQRVQERAVFALSQHRSERAGAALRAYIERDDAPMAVKERAILALSLHRRSAENEAFLKSLYGRLEDRSLKERVLMALAQGGEELDSEFLMAIAMDSSEDMELRKRALFWMGQTGDMSVADLTTLYAGVQDPELREQLVFVVAQRDEPGAVDFLIRVAEDDTNKELQTRAVFWLGQSKDPRAAEYLLRIINRQL